jgi:hypothetical protein
MSDGARKPVLFPEAWLENETTTEPFAGIHGTTKLTNANFSEASGHRFFTSHWVWTAVPLIDAWAKPGISPCTNARAIETGWFVWPEPEASDIVTLSPAGGGGGGVECETVTFTLLEIALFPELSFTFAAKTCEPLLAVVVSQDTE